MALLPYQHACVAHLCLQLCLPGLHLFQPCGHGGLHGAQLVLPGLSFAQYLQSQFFVCHMPAPFTLHVCFLLCPVLRAAARRQCHQKAALFFEAFCMEEWRTVTEYEKYKNTNCILNSPACRRQGAGRERRHSAVPGPRHTRARPGRAGQTA